MSKRLGFDITVNPNTVAKAHKNAGLSTTPSTRQKLLADNQKELKQQVQDFIHTKLAALVEPPEMEESNGRGSLPEKVKLLQIIDGLSSFQTYKVIAQGSKNPRQVIAVRKLGMGTVNAKFYPNFSAFGLTEVDLRKVGAEAFRSRPEVGYERCHVSLRKLKAVLELAQSKTTRATKLLQAPVEEVTDKSWAA